MSPEPLMTIFECVGCKMRYGKKRGEEVSSCPQCKSDSRVLLADPVLPPRQPDPETYMDLWRFAQPNERLFETILVKTNTTVLSQCPRCDGPTFIHQQDCWLRKMQDAELEAAKNALHPGKVLRYTCDKCTGSIVTLIMHHGAPQLFIECKASMGCQGQMEGEVEEEDVKHHEIRWLWSRPADPEGLSLTEESHCTSRAGLVLRRRKDEPETP